VKDSGTRTRRQHAEPRCEPERTRHDRRVGPIRRAGRAAAV